MALRTARSECSDAESEGDYRFKIVGFMLQLSDMYTPYPYPLIVLCREPFIPARMVGTVTIEQPTTRLRSSTHRLYLFGITTLPNLSIVMIFLSFSLPFDSRVIEWRVLFHILQPVRQDFHVLTNLLGGYLCVDLGRLFMLVCPKSRLTVSIGTPLDNRISSRCRNVCDDRSNVDLYRTTPGNSFQLLCCKSCCSAGIPVVPCHAFVLLLSFGETSNSLILISVLVFSS